MSAKEQRLKPSWLPLLLEYHRDTGLFFWLARDEGVHGEMFPNCTAAGFRAFNSTYAGKQAFTARTAQGYHVTGIGVPFLAHRVAWAYVTGAWPAEQIDHINGIRTDNRFVNLREATPLQNSKNRKPWARSSSQFLGVHKCGRSGKWGASIMSGLVEIRVGLFDCEIEAATARDAKAVELHGEFARLNFPRAAE